MAVFQVPQGKVVTSHNRACSFTKRLEFKSLETSNKRFHFTLDNYKKRLHNKEIHLHMRRVVKTKRDDLNTSILQFGSKSKVVFNSKKELIRPKEISNASVISQDNSNVDNDESKKEDVCKIFEGKRVIKQRKTAMEDRREHSPKILRQNLIDKHSNNTTIEKAVNINKQGLTEIIKGTVFKDIKEMLIKKAITKRKLSSRNLPQSTPMRSPCISNNYLKKLIVAKKLTIHPKTKSVNKKVANISEREARSNERKRAPLKDEMKELNYTIKRTHKFKFNKIKKDNLTDNSLYYAPDIENFLNKSLYLNSVRRVPITEIYNQYTSFKFNQIVKSNKKVTLPGIKSYAKNGTEYVLYYKNID